MKPYSKLTKEELKKLKGQLEKQFEEVKAKEYIWICPVVNRQKHSWI